MPVNLSGLRRESILGRVARWPLKMIPKSAVVPIMQGPFKGRKWIVGSSVHGCWLGSYELPKQRRLASFLKPGMTVYDIGANVGFYTLLSSVLVGPTGRVIAFEPVLRNLYFLRRHIELNHRTNVTVVEKAVSDREGTIAFDEGPDPAMGKIVPLTSAAAAEVSAPGLTVATTSIDALQAPPPSLMKIDVEGAELLVLRGAERTLRQARPVIFLATHGPGVHRDCCAFLESLGYRLTSLTGAPVDHTDEVLAEPGAA